MNEWLKVVVLLLELICVDTIRDESMVKSCCVAPRIALRGHRSRSRDLGCYFSFRVTRQVSG